MRTGALVTTALLGVGAAAVLRQRAEAAAVAKGTLPGLGPTGRVDDEPDEPPASGLHGVLAGWIPARPATSGGRALAAAWAGPMTAVGALASLASGTVPRTQPEGYLLAAEVGGIAGRFLASQGAAAATLGYVIVTSQRTPRPALLAHELVHVRQHERLGPLFAVAYPIAQARWGYRQNPFEVAARRGATIAISGPSEPA